MKKVLYLSLFSLFLFACQHNQAGQTEIAEAATMPSLSINAKAVATKSTEASDLWLESLITETPQEGRALAMKMARKTIGAIQSDGEVKKKVREQYADDAEFLIMAAQVVAIEFQTVAAANNYWKK